MDTAPSPTKRIHKEDWQQDVMCIYIRWLCIMCPNYILQYRLSSQYDNANVLNQCITLSPNLCIIPCNIKIWWFSNERPCICVHFASFNDCDIWFWNCLRLRIECTLFCNLQSRARTHTVFGDVLYELLGNPTT
jgi:hypothetical protein